jgi:hypothetical protein
MSDIVLKTLASANEISGRTQAAQLFRECPIPNNEVIANAGIFEKRQELTKQLFFNHIYANHIVKVHGVLMEFGVRWGQNMVTLNNLRGIYEPYNHNRKLIGFDTFEGFPDISKEDGNHASVVKGALSVSENYESYLDRLLGFHEAECPLAHIKKNFLVKGDSTKTLAEYLSANPQTIIAFAWFDFDIYEPTKVCLELIKPFLTKGSVIGFDELNDPGFPGETVALREVFGTSNVRIERNPFSGMQSYFVVE